MTTQEQQYINLLTQLAWGDDNTIDKPVHNHPDLFLRSGFCTQLRFDVSNELFPIFTTRKTAWKSCLNEMFWFLSGSKDVKELDQKRNCKFWTPWAEKANTIISESNPRYWFTPHSYKNYTFMLGTNDFERQFNIDQTKWIIDGVKRDPYRQHYLAVNWRPDEIYEMAEEVGNIPSVLPPCHFSHQVLVRSNKLCMHVTMRSCDVICGLPHNVAQYAMLLMLYAYCTGYEPGELVFTLADYHIYSNHIDLAKKIIAVAETEGLLPFPSFELVNLEDKPYKYLTDFDMPNIKVSGYKYHIKDRAPVAVVGGTNDSFN